MIYDISPSISPALAVFPGDTPPSREVLLDIDRGDHITLSTLRTTVHVGAHLDAPAHYGAAGETIETIDLDRVVGECQVIPVEASRGGRVGVAEWVDRVDAPRVLLATGTFPDPQNWNEDFAGLEPELIEALADRGVTLIGIDTPSVDPSTSKDLPAHATFFQRDLLILEGLVLNAVPAGRYDLTALPLKLTGFDASPVRAILRSLPTS